MADGKLVCQFCGLRNENTADAILREVVAAQRELEAAHDPEAMGTVREQNKAIERNNAAWARAEAYADGVPAVSSAADPQRNGDTK